MATLSEFSMFLYMGMGVFTGRFKGWDPTFVLLAVVFCLVARLFNTFPFSALANLWRRRKITGGMQVAAANVVQACLDRWSDVRMAVAPAAMPKRLRCLLVFCSLVLRRHARDNRYCLHH
jgi:NhaP-type Na+/H+ or K+/H+ antiporter